MSGLGIENLPNSQRDFRLGLDTRRDDGEITFESLLQCDKEDLTRGELLLNSVEDDAERDDSAELELASRLIEGCRTGTPYPTLSSSLYMRWVRTLVVGNLWPVVEAEQCGPASTVTLRPRRMWIPADQLEGARPPDMVTRLRGDFDRSGVRAARGWLLAGLHAEFDVRRLGYNFHFHCTGAGEKIAAIDESLRGQPKYRQSPPEPHEEGLPSHPRVRISKKPLFNLPDPLTYVVQSSYPHKPTFVDKTGRLRRGTRKRRIPEPYHTQWLLWMDRWSIDDMMLLNGLRVTREGFRVID